MCQAKINDYYGGRYICLRPDAQILEIEITYGNGHLKGKTKKYKRTLCSHHAKKERYKLNRKRERGHEVNVKIKNLD